MTQPFAPTPTRVAGQPVALDHVLAAPQQPLLERVEVLVRSGVSTSRQAGPRGGHRERVPVERADLVDGAALDDLEGLLGAADRAGREPAAERLGERDEVGLTPKRSVAPPAAMPRPVLTSSKISSTPSRVVSSRTASR